jgi:hypothetical protein
LPQSRQALQLAATTGAASVAGRAATIAALSRGQVVYATGESHLGPGGRNRARADPGDAARVGQYLLTLRHRHANRWITQASRSPSPDRGAGLGHSRLNPARSPVRCAIMPKDTPASPVARESSRGERDSRFVPDPATSFWWGHVEQLVGTVQPALLRRNVEPAGLLENAEPLTGVVFQALPTY